MGNFIAAKCRGKADIEEQARGSKKTGCWHSNRKTWGRLVGAVGGFVGVIVLGMLLYFLTQLDSDPPPTFVSCLYYSVISATTIGFGDEAPTTSTGRVITALFIL